MVNRDLSKEEKRRLTNERQKAVRNAWKEERELVINGKGTRDWNKAQQKELIEKGAVCGFNGHHMKLKRNLPNGMSVEFLIFEISGTTLEKYKNFTTLSATFDGITIEATI